MCAPNAHLVRDICERGLGICFRARRDVVSGQHRRSPFPGCRKLASPKRQPLSTRGACASRADGNRGGNGVSSGR